jgi:glycosyltransferase involved in cell wall biosynthesis
VTTAHDFRPMTGDAAAVWVVMAAYNEASVIAETIRELVPRFPNVVVVDDGSRDATYARARETGVHVVRHPINLGQGAALQTGIRYALRRGAGYVVTFDADGQHDVEDLPRMFSVLHERGADIVLGSRFLGSTTGMPAARRMMLKGAVFFTNFTAGVKLTDAHNGLRFMTAEAAARFNITQNGMAHASEFIEQIGRLKLDYIEVPVHIRYTEYSLGKGQRLSNALRILGELFSNWVVRW